MNAGIQPGVLIRLKSSVRMYSYCGQAQPDAPPSRFVIASYAIVLSLKVHKKRFHTDPPDWNELFVLTSTSELGWIVDDHMEEAIIG